MSRTTAPQFLIFTATFLAISIVANVLLFTGHDKLKTQFDDQHLEIKRLEQELDASTEFKAQQLAKVDAMSGQQGELATVIKELQQELVYLNNQYKASQKTAAQNKEQLRTAQQQINQLADTNKQQERLLAEANITINNQLRALKATQQDAVASTENNQVAAALNSAIDPTTDVTVAETANGETIIYIPLESLFTDNTLIISEQGQKLLAPIANTLAKLVDADITVIGHSDSRPIVSDLALRYPTNWELSAVRASKIVSFFISEGIEENNLTAAGKASNQPIREDATPQAWAVNRRIEIQIR